MPRSTVKLEVWLAFVFGLLALAVLFAVALFAQHQNPLLITVARVTLALACAGIAAVITVPDVPARRWRRERHSTLLYDVSNG